MAGHTSSYSIKNLEVTIDKRTIEGFWDGDDVVVIERNADNVTPIVGADGTATVSIMADDSANITLRLQPNSIANQILHQKFLQNRSGRIAPFFVSIRDTGNGEGGSAGFCVVTKRPNIQHGDAATVREWVLFANPWNETQVTYNEV